MIEKKKHGHQARSGIHTSGQTNMEGPIWVSEVLEDRMGEYARQPGQGRGWGENSRRKEEIYTM